MNILMFMTGSIACAKATGLISLWTKNGHNVKVIASQSALEFVGIATLEGLSGNDVITSVFEENKMMDHINLSREADLMVLIPATANTINKLNQGIADDMITTTWVAALDLKKPMYIVPAMNTKMWEYPATQHSIKKLQNWGVNVLFPDSGELACGEKGNGRMMEIETIDSIIMKKKSKKILITAGGTREYIDGVRYIGNLSTGKTGSIIADFFSSQNYQVIWLGAKNAIQPKLNCQKIYFETFNDLQTQLQSILQTQHFTTVIQAAAISDFTVSSVLVNEKEIESNRKSKLPTSETMNIKLKQNPKLINNLKHWSLNKNVKIVGFKLTNTSNVETQQLAIQKLLSHSNIDFVAHNDLSDITENSHSYSFYKTITVNIPCKSTNDLCHTIMEETT